MANSNKYATSKGRHVEKEMAEGKTNKEAHRSWRQSEQYKSIDERRSNCFQHDATGIDRSSDSPMQDWAETTEDF